MLLTCPQELESLSKLVQHMVQCHLLRDLKENYQAFYDGENCLECNKSFNKTSIWLHLGAVHNKVDDILIKKGMRPLKTPIVHSFKTIKVKTEIPDEEESEVSLKLFENASEDNQVGEEDENSLAEKVLFTADPLSSS